MPTQFSLGELVGAAGSAGVTLQRIRFWFDTSPAAAADQEIPGGELGPLTVNFATRVATAEFDLTPAVPAAIDPQDFLKDDPLFRHINTNRSYYLGILGRAAQRIPSLRFDAPQLQNVPQEVWRLPIVGFEGHRIVVIRDADPADPFVARLLSDPGAATLIQIAAPGAYAEALQGILSLTDALGKVHPALIPAPAPVMPPLALVDLTGKQLQVIGGGAGTGTGTGTGTITGP
jgi:hypothetical protein